jgi:putative hydrolases of HD superfamily
VEFLIDLTRNLSGFVFLAIFGYDKRTGMIVGRWPRIKIKNYNGVWRSWLARTHGVREVAGSSPATPTNLIFFIFFMKRDVQFLYEIGCLRFVQRVWKQFLNPDFANLAEHTLRVAWIALLIAKREGVGDQEKIIKMAMIHDVPESRAGDIHYVSRQYTTRNEVKALDATLVGTSLQEELTTLWREYEKRESIEAKIVKDADNLDVDLELQEQASRGYSLKENFMPIRKVVAEDLFTQTAQDIWAELYSTNPHDWHMKGLNRFTGGDWKKSNDGP